MRAGLVPVLAGKRAGKTYADFQAFIAARATSGVLTWSFGAFSSGNRKYRTTPGSLSGSMQGTPWGGAAVVGTIRAMSNTPRIVQHCMPSLAALNLCISNGWEIYLEKSIDVAGGTDLAAYARNSYTSEALTGAYTELDIVTELLYWDGTQAMRMVPVSASGPTPFPF